MNNASYPVPIPRRMSPVVTVYMCLLFMIIPVSLTAESLTCEPAAGGRRLVGSANEGYVIKMADASFSRLASPGDSMLPFFVKRKRVWRAVLTWRAVSRMIPA